ncbi:MAG TPA: TerB family tellurite resistance protein, partial [Phenylobacterium sp.]|nr:TerB family tellurite resistance protein [Phenylobacterium sp.]
MAAGDVAEIGVRPMAALLGCAAEAGARGALLRQIGGALDAFGLGFEPDRRFGASGGAEVDDLVVFRLPGEACDPDNPAFASARIMAEIGALAAVADGAVVGAEFEAIRSDLFALEGLNSAERIRLLAYLQALLKAPPKQTAALNRLAKTPLADRDAIAQAALGAVLADGRVTPAEVKYLERLNKALGLPAEDIYAALHRGSVRVDEPVVIAAAAPARGSPIPPEPAAPIIAFDPARLQRVRQETSAVSSLLAGIFTEAP